MEQNVKIRCSQLYNLMVEPKKKDEVLSETTKSYLKQLYRELKYNRRKEISSKYLMKGLKMEEDAITLLSLHLNKFLKKNTERLINEYLSGEPDVYLGDSIINCDEGYDTKCSWSLDTFPFSDTKLQKEYYYQDLGYMMLTGAKKWSTAYCLLDMPTDLLLNELERESYKWKERDTPNWREIEIIKNYTYAKDRFDEMISRRGCMPNDEKSENMLHSFIEIPKEERILIFEVKKDEKEFEKIKERINLANEYLKTL